jgi:hypothetical protein
MQRVSVDWQSTGFSEGVRWVGLVFGARRKRPIRGNKIPLSGKLETGCGQMAGAAAVRANRRAWKCLESFGSSRAVEFGWEPVSRESGTPTRTGSTCRPRSGHLSISSSRISTRWNTNADGRRLGRIAKEEVRPLRVVALRGQKLSYGFSLRRNEEPDVPIFPHGISIPQCDFLMWLASYTFNASSWSLSL